MNNPLDCDSMGLFGLGVEVADLGDGGGDIRVTVAGEVEEHPDDGEIAPGLVNWWTIRIGAKGFLSAREKVGLAVLEASGGDNFVDEAALGKSVFIFVSLLKLNAKELHEASFPHEVKPLLLQLVD